jgi:hypothetical protein
MYRSYLLSLAILAAMAVPASAGDSADLCTEAHMKRMEEKIAAMTDADMQKSAKMHLDASKAEMEKNNTAGCMEHMNEAHKAMGM